MSGGKGLQMGFNREATDKLIQYIENSVTPYHTVGNVKNRLKAAGFSELDIRGDWKLRKNAGYFTAVFGSACVAFYVGSDFKCGSSLKVIAAHTDSPCLRIKTSPERVNADGTLSINTEVYGGPILNTWLDRPLCIAGRVMLRGKTAFAPETQLVNLKKSIAVIPNLAIHMNRDVNKGTELNRQTDMLPFLGGTADDDARDKYAGWLLAAVSKELGREQTDILGYDLFVYNNEKPEICGIDDSLLSAPRIDNISSVCAGCEAFADAAHSADGLSVLAVWDNEEVGSQTKQGGDSQTLAFLLEKIYLSLGVDRREYLSAVLNGLVLSADVAHAAHPNHPEKSDITNHVYLNKGVVFKMSGNQKYASDGETLAIYRAVCENNKIPYQLFANRSDIPGGSTIGSLMSSHLPMRTLDLGIPVLAMHSARELCGTADQEALYRLMKVFCEA